jgi:hypothetical protein
MAVHFVGFCEDSHSFHQAVKVFGKPDFFHRVWDARAKFGGEFDPENDVRVFLKGDENSDIKPFVFDDSATV